MVAHSFEHTDFIAYAYNSQQASQEFPYAQDTFYWQHALGEASWATQTDLQLPCAFDWNQDFVSVEEVLPMPIPCENVAVEPAYVWNVGYLQQTSSCGSLSNQQRTTFTNDIEGEKSMLLCDELVDPELEEDGVTTAMVRNLPDHVKQSDVVKKLNSTGFNGLYNFCYVPSTFNTARNKGYAFINFLSNRAYSAFMNAWHGNHIFGGVGSVTTLNVTKAAIQGLEQNVQRWNGPRIRRIRNPEFRPYVVQSSKTSEKTGSSSLLGDPMVVTLDVLCNESFNFSDAGIAGADNAGSIDMKLTTQAEQYDSSILPAGLPRGCDSDTHGELGYLLPPPPGLSPFLVHSI